MTSAHPPPSPSTPHRLIAVSASQALSSQSSHISTGSNELDKAVGGDGLPRGKVSELVGPPGSGKTAMAMQMAANTLLAGNRVVWIDTSHPFPASRLVSMISAHSHPEGDPLGHLSSLQILQVPTLAHLLALFLHPLPSFPPEGTALVVIDNIATAFGAAFPPGLDDYNKRNDRGQSSGGKASPSGKGSHSGKAAQPTVKKFSIMADLMKSFDRLALTHGLAILVLNQMATKVIPGSEAVLQPAVNSPAWALTLTTRLLIHRNDISPFVLSDPSSTPIPTIRFVTILKANGVSHDPETTKTKTPVVVLQIQEGGISDVELVNSSTPTSVLTAAVTMTVRTRTSPPSPVGSKSPVRSPIRKKRKRGVEAGVVPGSDEEDSEEEWGSGLDDDGLGAELPTANVEQNVGFTTLGVGKQV